MKRLLLMLALVLPMCAFAEEVRINDGWLFRKAQSAEEQYSAERVEEAGWQSVCLPHTPQYVEFYTSKQWVGNC